MITGNGKSVIPERLFNMLRSCELNDDPGYFPASEVFNEGWMLRLLLHAIQSLNVQKHPLSFVKGSSWYSEALLTSPFRPRFKQDRLGEGFTNADAVMGHFDFRSMTKTGLGLSKDAKQFIVLEAKMSSNLSSGTKNAPGYDQAARNVACMASTIAKSGLTLSSLDSIGFFVIAPEITKRRFRDTNLEACVNPESMCKVVGQRIAAYELSQRTEAIELREWEKGYFHPLVQRLSSEGTLAVLSWETLINEIGANNQESGEELSRFYERCLDFAPSLDH